MSELNLFKKSNTTYFMKSALFASVFLLLLFLILTANASAAPAGQIQLLNFTPENGTAFDFGSFTKISACWSILPAATELWSNESGSLELKAIPTIFGNCTFISYKTPEKATAMLWTLRASNSSGYSNSTGENYFLARDLSAPQFFEFSQSGKNIPGGVLQINIRIKDNLNLSAAILSVDETGSFKNVSEMKLSGTDAAAIFSYNLSQNLTEGSRVGWKIFANDSSGNFNSTDENYFTLAVCPQTCGGYALGSCTQWSECSAGEQKRLCFSCGRETGFLCSKNVESKACAVVLGKAEAESAISDAESGINSVKASDVLRNTTEAEFALKEARKAFDAKDYKKALELAENAKALSASAPVIVTEKTSEPQNFIQIILIIIILIIFAVAAYLNRKKIISILQKKTGSENINKIEKPANTCEICGRQAERLYTCSSCGKKICFDDARTYMDSDYCVDCLRRRGLL